MIWLGRERCWPDLAAGLLLGLALSGCDPRARGGAGEAPSADASPVGTADAAPPAATSSARADAAAPAELAFVRDGRRVRTLSREALAAATPPVVWTAYDPYYARPKTYRALALGPVLEKGFGEPLAELVKHDYVLRARDGYAVPIPGAKLLEPGGYLAIADVDVPGWEPIGEARANPGPFYLVWRETSQRSLDTHPRPWQLATIEIAPFEATYPHIVPRGEPDDGPAMRGYRIFREQCVSCHAVNREGGRVGPDLNVPQSVVEYRPAAQIRAYIRDPKTFRYSTMPAHPAFTDGDLDALLAYFTAMKTRKYDPEADAGGGGK